MPSLKPFLARTGKAMVPRFLVVQKLVKRRQKRVLLSFDDGPHAETTPRVLDELDRFGARAIFFLPGSRIPRAPRLVREILARGHLIGNHTYAHDENLHPRLGGYLRDILAGQSAIRAAGGGTPVLFRPPFGLINLPVLLAAMGAGLRIVRWSIESGEYSFMRKFAPQTIAGRLLDRIHDQDIVLMHDDYPRMPEILGIILPELEASGYDLRTGVEDL